MSDVGRVREEETRVSVALSPHSLGRGGTSLGSVWVVVGTKSMMQFEAQSGMIDFKASEPDPADPFDAEADPTADSHCRGRAIARSDCES